MSRDHGFITKSLDNPIPLGYNNTTRSQIHNTSILNNNNSFNTNNWNITATDDRSEVLTWLSPLDPNLRHYGVQMRRVDDVGGWLLRTEEFRSWYRGGEGESQKATIFCYGNPGVGKTYISSLVIDTLCDGPGGAGEEDKAVACFYFDFAAQKEQSAAGVLGALLKQIVAGFKQIPKEIMDAFEKQKKVIGGRRLRLPEVVKLLGSLTSSRRTFFCLDAMGECGAPDRAKILLSLRDIIEASPTTRVFMTGRPHVGGDVERHLPGGVAAVSIRPQKDDMVQYIHTKLAEDATPEEMDERLEAEIVKRIPESVSEIFLLVSLNLDAVLQETTIRRRRERLGIMTDGLGLEDAYGATLGRINAQGGQKSRLGMAALMWVCHSQRPLGAEELCQALAVEIGSAEYSADNAPSIQTVLSCCQGLIVADKEGLAVRFIHYTLQEYLTTRPGLFQSPDSTIAETCLTFLNSRQIIAISASDFESTQHTRFLQYSSLYWGTHLKKEPSDRGRTLALELFGHYEGHISIKLLLGDTLGSYSVRSGAGLSKFTRLHCASLLGLVEVVRVLADTAGVDINGVDGTGATALLWAARGGHEEVVKLLLEQEDIIPDKPDPNGQTPISWAAAGGHEAVVELLLGRGDVNPDRPDVWCTTPISWAAMNGHEAVMKSLLGRENVNADRLDVWCRTPISWAAMSGHEAVVELLLGREDVGPDRPDDDSKTPISWAAMNGHVAVVRLLLGREGVNPDRLDNNRITPISWAAMNGHEAVVKLLLGCGDVNPDRPDEDGRTPISWAARNGHKAVVELLLGLENVNPDRLDRWCRTPISWAAASGHEAVVKLFLGCGDVNPDRPDEDGKTPISWAVRNGHKAVVELLLGLEDVSPDRPDRWCRTPISRAAGGGHEAVVKLLMGWEGVNPDSPDEDGRTPISWAAENGREEVVKLLLARKDVNPDRPDRWGQTPISWATGAGHEKVVELLQARERCQPR